MQRQQRKEPALRLRSLRQVTQGRQDAYGAQDAVRLRFPRLRSGQAGCQRYGNRRSCQGVKLSGHFTFGVGGRFVCLLERGTGVAAAVRRRWRKACASRERGRVRG